MGLCRHTNRSQTDLPGYCLSCNRSSSSSYSLKSEKYQSLFDSLLEILYIHQGQSIKIGELTEFEF
jgi:hypothetical protein